MTTNFNSYLYSAHFLDSFLRFNIAKEFWSNPTSFLLKKQAFISNQVYSDIVFHVKNAGHRNSLSYFDRNYGEIIIKDNGIMINDVFFKKENNMNDAVILYMEDQPLKYYDFSPDEEGYITFKNTLPFEVLIKNYGLSEEALNYKTILLST